jgi:hypothetical protein
VLAKDVGKQEDYTKFEGRSGEGGLSGLWQRCNDGAGLEAGRDFLQAGATLPHVSPPSTPAKIAINVPVSTIDDEYTRTTLELADNLETYFTMVRGNGCM